MVSLIFLSFELSVFYTKFNSFIPFEGLNCAKNSLLNTFKQSSDGAKTLLCWKDNW